MNVSLCADALSTARGLQFDAAAKSLVFAGARTRVAWADVLGAITVAGGLQHKVELGDVVLCHGATGFDLALKGDPTGKSGHIWRTRCTAFAGKAALSVSKDKASGDWVVSLKSARFAGTQIPADFEARLHVNSAGICQLSVKFAWGGFGATVAAALWLSGMADLTGDSLHAASLLSCGSLAGVRGNPEKLVTVKFHRAWIFECAGEFVFESGDTHQTLESLVVALATSKMLVRSSRGWRRRSLVLLGAKAGVRLVGLDISSPEGCLTGLEARPYPLLSLSFAEENRGGKETVLVALPGAVKGRVPTLTPATAWAFGKGLTAHDGSPWSVHLTQPSVVARFEGKGVLSELHVQAQLGNAETWAHAGRASLLVRGPRLPYFQYSKVGDKTWMGHPSQAKLHPGLDFTLGSLVVRAGDALVTDPVAAPSGTVVRFGAAAPSLLPLGHLVAQVCVSWEAQDSCLLRTPVGLALGYSRPADLLNLQFRLRDFSIQGGPGRGYQLLRLHAPGCMEVIFPPQSICEESRNEPLPAKFNLLTPAADQALPPPKHLMAFPSVLAFSTEASQLRLDEATLLGWLTDPVTGSSGIWTPLLSKAAHRGVKLEGPTWEPGTTGIEMPYGLIISGNENARWRGFKGPRSTGGRNELWHVSEYMRSALGAVIAPSSTEMTLGTIAAKAGIGGLVREKSLRGLKAFTTADTVTQITTATERVLDTSQALGSITEMGSISELSDKLLAGGLTPAELADILALLADDDSVPMKAIHVTDKPTFKNPLSTLLSVEPRDDIVKNSNRKSPFSAHQLILSPLGAWLNAEANWNSVLEQWKHRATLGRDHFVKIVLRGHLLPFGHRAVLVRTSERKVASSRNGVKEAIIFDRYFIIVRQHERLFPDSEGNLNGLSDDARAYRRMMPFQKVELLTKETGLLEEPPKESNKSRADAKFWPRPLGHKNEFWQFKLRGTDRAGKTTTWHMPMLFVLGLDDLTDDSVTPALPAETEADFFTRVAKQAASEGLSFDRSVQSSNHPDPDWTEAKWITHLHNQVVTLADGITGQHSSYENSVLKSKPTSFEPIAMGFGTTLFKCWVSKAKTSNDGLIEAGNPFLPVLLRAEMSTPSLKKFHASAGLALGFADVYLRHGLSSEGNPQDVLLQHPDFKTNGCSKTALSKEATGGVAAPLPRIAGISRKLGIVGGNSTAADPLANVAKGQFHPADYFKDTPATLLGGLRFEEILEELTIGAGSAAETAAQTALAVASMPRWLKRMDGDTEILALNWETRSFKRADKQGADLLVHFVSNDSTRLALTVEHRKIDGRDSVYTKGTLSNFGIDFANMLQLDFISFSFESRDGGKPEIHVNLDKEKALTFKGDLAFVDKLSKALDLMNFMDPPYLDIDSEGVTCGYNIRIPTVAIGVFALQNMALDARICLPFVSKPLSVRFALSERHNPFLLTVSLFTGGGFFAIEIDAEGNRFIEASLEAGGSLSVDLGLAKGEAYVMLGLYFSYSTAKQRAVISGYFRMGGSLVVLGFITVSTEFYLELTFVIPKTGPVKVAGEGRLTLEVKIAFFTVSVELCVRRELEGGSQDLGFEDLMPEPDLELYFGAFDQQEANT